MRESRHALATRFGVACGCALGVRLCGQRACAAANITTLTLNTHTHLLSDLLPLRGGAFSDLPSCHAENQTPGRARVRVKVKVKVKVRVRVGVRATATVRVWG